MLIRAISDKMREWGSRGRAFKSPHSDLKKFQDLMILELFLFKFVLVLLKKVPEIEGNG